MNDEQYLENHARFAAIESLIESASDYVVPSPDLRPRVLDEVREEAGQRILAKRISLAALAVICVWAVIAPVSQNLEHWRDRISIPTGTEVEAAALRLAAESHRDAPWAMVEAFQQTRTLPTQLTNSVRH